LLALLGPQLSAFDDLVKHLRLFAANLCLSTACSTSTTTASAVQLLLQSIGTLEHVHSRRALSVIVQQHVMSPSLTAQAHRVHQCLTGACPLFNTTTTTKKKEELIRI
jgi:hypothetical protein